MHRQPTLKRHRPACHRRLMIALLLVVALDGIAFSEVAIAKGKKKVEPQSIDDLFGGPAAIQQPPALQVTPPPAKSKSPEEAPRTLDALFVDPPATALPVEEASATPATVPPVVSEGKAEKGPASVDDLFGGPAPNPLPPSASQEIASPTSEVTPATMAHQQTPPPARVTGFFQNDLAYAYKSPTHWTKFRSMLDLSSTGQFSGGISWKLGGRLMYDPIYDLTSHYNRSVRNDQRFEAQIREAYVDIPADDWEFRLGRQHIIWGEMVGLFFADVVSAKDLRELALPDFEILRIPQWAARAEYFKGDFHAEGVWIPHMTYDDIGKPGAEFYPFRPPAGISIAPEDKPTGLANSAYGTRLSYLKSGWDISGFYYSTNDPTAAFTRLAPTLYQPIHDRIHQLGATLGKDLGPMVFKAEAVYTKDKLFNVTTPTDADGLVKQNLFDYIVGLEWSFPQETRLNVQFYQRRFPDPEPGMLLDSTESGFTFLISTQALHPKVEPRLLFLRSINRNDWLAQFKVTWRLDGNWRLAAGADIFGGDAAGLFGQYGNKDRIYTEIRYNF
jgi:hypothetical protein